MVAIKVMILPSGMSGKERREKMAVGRIGFFLGGGWGPELICLWCIKLRRPAPHRNTPAHPSLKPLSLNQVMETAISSSLSHPNIVQTFTYSIKSVTTESNNTRRSSSAKASAKAAAAGGLHDSSASFPENGAAAAAAAATAEQQQGELGTGNDVHSWELRLVQELCDLGSLRDALSAGVFKAPASAAAAAATAQPPAAAAAAAAAGAGGSGSSAAGQAAAGGPGLAGQPPAQQQLQAQLEVDFLKVLDTALDVARAMAHLHAQVCSC